MSARSAARNLLDGAVAAERDKVQAQVAPITARYDRGYLLDCMRGGRFPRELWHALGETGLLQVGVAERNGGSGGGLVAMVAVMEALAAEGLPLASLMITAFARELLLRHGSAEQWTRAGEPTLTRNAIIAFAMTEREAGTNVWRIGTTARRDPDGSLLLNGQKIYISGANVADYVICVCRLEPEQDAPPPGSRRAGIVLVLVDPRSEGVTITPMDMVTGIAEQQCAVTLNQVRVSANDLIGDSNAGSRLLFDTLNVERTLGAAWAVGVGDFGLTKAVGYARQRIPFGRAIGSYQALQHPMAHVAAELDSARLMTYAAARMSDDGADVSYLANAAKLLASEAGERACDIAIQVHGGFGYERDSDVITLWPLARVLRTIPVSNELLLNYIGQHVLDLPRSY
jgi:acyl-CoA dehydrogenase